MKETLFSLFLMGFYCVFCMFSLFLVIYNEIFMKENIVFTVFIGFLYLFLLIFIDFIDLNWKFL